MFHLLTPEEELSFCARNPQSQVSGVSCDLGTLEKGGPLELGPEMIPALVSSSLLGTPGICKGPGVGKGWLRDLGLGGGPQATVRSSRRGEGGVAWSCPRSCL